MLGGPVFFCQLLVQVPERVSLLLIRRLVACRRNLWFENSFKASEGRNIYCNTL